MDGRTENAVKNRYHSVYRQQNIARHSENSEELTANDSQEYKINKKIRKKKRNSPKYLSNIYSKFI